MNLNKIIEKHWQKPNPILSVILSPLARIFAYIAQNRRQKYLSGSLKTQKLPIPVIVVGNIHVGGTGKTPIVAKLVSNLQERGIKVGIISRGYGRKLRDIHVLQHDSTAEQAGDEPLMLYRQTYAPTAVGKDRYAAGMALLAQHSDLQVIVSDDGLQHYSLARDIEIAVFPATDVGRDDLDYLPNGGLRESITRLQYVDFIIISNSDENILVRAQTFFRQPEKLFTSQIQIFAPYRLNQPHDVLLSDSLKKHETCAAIAGIARPERFFNSLKNLGFDIKQKCVLPDHTSINLANLPVADYVFITEKDAIKLSDSVPNHVWVLPIRATIQPDLADVLVQKIMQ